MHAIVVGHGSICDLSTPCMYGKHHTGINSQAGCDALKLEFDTYCITLAIPAEYTGSVIEFCLAHSTLILADLI